jgi:hypothetical protein
MSKTGVLKTGETYAAVFAPTMDGPNFTRDLMKVFDVCNQSLPDARLSACELRCIVERKTGRAQKVLGSFEGVTEERMRVRVGKEEFEIGQGVGGKKRRIPET